MSLKGLGCQVSKSANSDTWPRPTTQVAVDAAAGAEAEKRGRVLQQLQQTAERKFAEADFAAATQVRMAPCRPSSWANSSFYSCIPTDMHGPTASFGPT